MWFIGVEVEQETSAPPPKKNPGSAPAYEKLTGMCRWMGSHFLIELLEWGRTFSDFMG